MGTIHANFNALNTRAVAVTNAPTQSVMSIVSEEQTLNITWNCTSLASPSQDKMFIRFSDQEIEQYAPTSTNTAGTLG